MLSIAPLSNQIHSGNKVLSVYQVYLYNYREYVDGWLAWWRTKNHMNEWIIKMDFILLPGFDVFFYSFHREILFASIFNGYFYYWSIDEQNRSFRNRKMLSRIKKQRHSSLHIRRHMKVFSLKNHINVCLNDTIFL